ncbi:hypothetical protein AQUCO_06800054v1 [Aquilegia coerulea]|uniref:Fibronectin type III-like domain-containing protein n=1 Tax=Aquilegia coerulea TaxID=218851 RepID=A0A2G5CCP2_AQUCA|nr:hypothetical protein AQUCO_06800054v1 [Aquilegia coerulea]
MASFQVLFALVFCHTLSCYGVQAETIVCEDISLSKFPFCDQTLPYNVRVKDLVDRMTLDEKIAQLGDSAPGVKRLGFPGYEWWSEALHGVSDAGRAVRFDSVTPSATSFPTVILTAAAFNESLWKSIGVAISNEARALHNVGLSSGLTFWAPNINVVRDPRWGRTMETPGEDPFVVGRYAVNYVRGMQDVEGFLDTSDPNSRPLKIGACCKHYTAYDVDHWNGVDKYHFDARVTERDMMETFMYPFEMCVKEGDAASLMSSYNSVNGIPTCADPMLLSQTIRGLWALHGYIVSDCESLKEMVIAHNYLNNTPADAVARALKAGIDLDCGSYYTSYAMEAVKKGKVKVVEIDKALKNLYLVLMRLGWFDGSPGNYAALGRSDVCSTQNLELAAEAARQGIVLLKNDHDILPLNFSGKRPTLAVVGPHGNATSAMVGNYAVKIVCRYSTPLNALGAYAIVKYAPGCSDVKCRDINGFAAAAEATKGTDATILFMGLDLSIEDEALDRLDLKLPGYQDTLINSIANASTGPLILVLFSAGGIDISNLKNNPKVPAIVWAGYPGAEGGRAIADVLFGYYNPGEINQHFYFN